MQSTSTSKPPGTTHPLALLFVTATLLHAALAFNKTDALLYHVGVAHTESVQALPGSRPSTVLRDEPGEDAELQGVPIYDSVHDIPPYKVRGEDGSFEKCFRGMHQFCLKASFCGYDCEQVRYGHKRLGLTVSQVLFECGIAFVSNVGLRGHKLR